MRSRRSRSSPGHHRGPARRRDRRHPAAPAGPEAEPVADEPLGEELVVDESEANAAAETVAEPEAHHAVAADAADDVAAVEAHEAATEAEADATDAPPSGVFGAVTYEAPAVDAYSLRLVTYRKLYDQGTLVQAALSLAGLAAGTGIAANPRTSTASASAPTTGSRSPRPGSRSPSTIVPDASIPVGTVAMAIGQGDPSPTVLIDATSPVTGSGWRRSDVRQRPAARRPPGLGHRRHRHRQGGITLVITLLATMLMIWFERKIISDLQNRIGPNFDGPFGILQTLADGLKVLLKEDLIPDQSDKWVFLAPHPHHGPSVHRVLGHPARRRLPRRQRRRGLHLRPRHHAPARRPRRRRARDPRHVLHRRVRRDARRLVLGLEVPAARLGPGHRPDGQLRGGPRPVRAGRGAHHGVPLDQRDRPRRSSRAGTCGSPAPSRS